MTTPLDDLPGTLLASCETETARAIVNVQAAMAEYMRRKFDEDYHEMLQMLGLAPDLRWWKP